MICAATDVPNFIVKDSFEDARTRFVALRPHAFDCGRSDVEGARLEHHGHHRQPRRNVVPGIMGRGPQARMRRMRAIVAAQCVQVPVKQCEVHRLVRRDRQKVAHERLTHFRAESSRHVEREVDRLGLRR